jgi:hypothetical protein
MREVLPPSRLRSLPSALGLATASILCLCAGALLAVAHEGLARLLFAASGFTGYLFFFAHALNEIALPRVLVEGRPGPDGEVRGEPVQRKATDTANRNRDLTLAA